MPTESTDWSAFIHFATSPIFGNDADTDMKRICDWFCWKVLNRETIASSVGPLDLSPTKSTSSINTKRTALANSQWSFHLRVIESHFSGVVTQIWNVDKSVKSAISIGSESPVAEATSKWYALNFCCHFWNISLHSALFGATTYWHIDNINQSYALEKKWMYSCTHRKQSWQFLYWA